MSQDTHTRRLARAGRGSRIGLALLLGLAVCLVAAPLAQAKFAVKQLRVGSISGPQDYLFTAGNTVVEQGTVDRGDYYRFDVYNPSGTDLLTTPCRAASHNGNVGGSYILQNTDPLSNSNAWRFRLQEFTSSSACSSGSGARNDKSLYFDVAAASSYSSSALAAQQSLFGANSTAYVLVHGVGEPKTSGTNAAEGPGTWTTTWIAPSGTTACANTTNNANDLPGSTAGGQLPDRTSLPSPAQANLEYRPSSVTGPDAWNNQANYELGPCPAFATGNQGQWSLKLSAGSNYSVTLPVFRVDTTPPTTTLTSGPSHAVASTTATFDFTSSESNSTFQCSLDGAPPSPCTSPETYPGLGDGAHTFTVQAIDPAGNVDPTGATASWTVDATAPAVTLTAPVAGGYTNDTTPALSGTAETTPGDSAVTVMIYSGTGTSGSPIETQTASVPLDGSWSVNASTLADGTYTVQAEQTDEVSHVGYSDAHTFTVDTTPPPVTVSTPLNGTHTNDSSPQISGTASTAPSDDSTVTVTVNGSGAPVVETANVSPSGQWVVNLPSALSDGNYTIQAVQQDLAGNTGIGTSHVTIDTTPPQTFLDASPVGTTSSTTATFSFHGTDALSQAGMTFQCQLDGGAWGLCTSPISYFNLANGTHTFAVEAIDGAGNVDMTGQSATWTVNTVLPAISLQSPTNGSYTNDSTPSFSGVAGTAAGNSSTVQVLIYSGTDVSGTPVQTLSTTAASDGSWMTTAATLPDGNYAAYAQQAGTAGTATSDVHTFTVDTQAPTTTITVGPPGNSGSGQASFSFSSSAPGATFQCKLDGGSWSACSSPQDYTGLSNGSHVFQVRATDEAGNVGPAASQTWSVNTNLPALSISSPSDGATTDNPALAISGTGGVASGDAGTVTVELYSGTSTSGTAVETLSTPVSSGAGAWTTHPSPALQDGTYTVYAEQTGTAGTAYTAAYTFTVDTTPPTTTITAGPQGTTSATSARFAFSSSEPGSTFQCQLDGGPWTACTSPQSYSSLAIGTHSFSVQATDPAGNTDANPPVDSWTIDTAANSPVTLTSPADGTDTNDTTPTFSGGANSKNGDITVEIDDVNGDPVEFLDATAANSWSVAATQALPDGTYTAFASQLGSDGITTDYSSPIELTIDTTPPAVTLTSGPSSLGNDNTPTFSGNAGTASGDLSTVTLDIYSGSSASGTPVQTIPVTAGDSSWSATAAVLPDGTYTAQASQTDSAGNTGHTHKRTFTIDTVAPDTTISAGPPASTSTPSASFSFTSSKTGSTFACSLDSGAWTACTSPMGYAGLSVGPHTFAVRATDPAGNVDPTPATSSWTITAPSGSGATGGAGTGGTTGTGSGSGTSTGGTGTGTGGTGSTGTGTGTGTSGSGTPTAKVQLSLTAKSKQILSRRGQLKIQIRCVEACSLVFSGKLVIAAKPKPHTHPKPRTITIRRLLAAKAAAGKRVTLTIKLSASERKAITTALAGKRKVTLTVSGVATAHGMLPGTAHVTIHLIR